MRIPRVGILRILVRFVYSIFGYRMGRVKVLQSLFRWFMSWAVPPQHVLVGANGYRLGMTIGGIRGFDEEAISLLFGVGYEVRMTEMFKSVVKPNMNVVDVGAHIGYYTVLASMLVGSNGKVWAFEPEPRNYTELVDNIKLNKCDNVVTVPQAIGNGSGKESLFFYGKFSGQRSLIDIGQKHHGAVNVEVVSLDEFIGGQKVDVIKIDVDGGEMGVLMGMRDLLGRNPQVKIFTEIWETGLIDAGFSCADYWNLLSNHGFRYIYLLDDRKGESVPMDFDGLRFYLDGFGGANLLCSRSAIARSGFL